MARNQWNRGVMPFGWRPPPMKRTRGVFRRGGYFHNTGRIVSRDAAAYRYAAYGNKLMRYGVMRRLGGFRGLMRRELYGRRKR